VSTIFAQVRIVLAQYVPCREEDFRFRAGIICTHTMLILELFLDVTSLAWGRFVQSAVKFKKEREQQTPFRRAH